MKARLFLVGLFVAAFAVGFCVILLVRLEMRLPTGNGAAAGDRSPSGRSPTPVSVAPPIDRVAPEAPAWKGIWEKGPSRFKLDFPVLRDGRIARECAELLALTPSEEAALNEILADQLRQIEEHNARTLTAEELSDGRVALVVPRSAPFSARLSADFSRQWTAVIGPERYAVMSSSIHYREQMLRTLRYSGYLEQVCVLHFGPEGVEAEVALNRYASTGIAGKNLPESDDAPKQLTELIPLRRKGPVTPGELDRFLGAGWVNKLPEKHRGAFN